MSEPGTRKPLIDEIERLGAEVAAGRMDREVAAQQLVDYPGARLTLVGARGMLANWKMLQQQASGSILMVAGMPSSQWPVS